MKQRLMIVWAIAQKDIVDAIRQQYLFFNLLLPFIIALVFGFMPQGADAANPLNIVAYDPGDSRLVMALQTLPQVELSTVSQPEAVLLAVEQDQIGGLIIPTSFDAEVQSRQQPELTVYINGDKSALEQQSFQQLIEQQVWALGEQPTRIDWVDNPSTPAQADPEDVSPDVGLFIGLSVIALVINGISLVPLLIVEEKEKHTLQALLVSPAHPGDIAFGKGIAGLIYSLLSVAILVALYQGWQGDWPVSIVVLLLGALAMVALGLIVGSVCHTSMHVNVWGSLLLFVLLVPTAILMFDVPFIVTIILQAFPTYHLIHVLQLSLAGETATVPLQVVSSIVMLLLIILMSFGSVAWLLRREEG